MRNNTTSEGRPGESYFTLTKYTEIAGLTKALDHTMFGNFHYLRVPISYQIA